MYFRKNRVWHDQIDFFLSFKIVMCKLRVIMVI